VGFFLLGPGTLLDLSLALFIGIAVGTYSSIFIATPVLADLREREPAMKKLKIQAERYQARQTSTASSDGDQFAPEGENIQDTVPVSAGSGTSASGRTLHPYVQTGPRNQPKRPPKSKR
jgi:preprotein translocase subunit SecF